MELSLFVFLMGVLTGIVGTTAYAVVVAKVPVPNIGFGRIAGNIAPLLVVAFVALAVLAPQFTALAQETPVPLDIPVNEVFTSTNSWMATFAPIAAIGIGIAVALAILGYLGKMIVSAFKG